MKNYWYLSKTNDGWENLALDEWFIDNLSPDDIMLYFYINENAVIIGKNQNPWKECNLPQMEKDNVQLVRRITGGGAVYHDLGNLNFSFIAGENRYDLDKQLNLILKAVESFGIECEFSGRNDLLADGKKFSGNAFCVRKNIKQHHGTLLVNSDLNRLQNYLNVDPKKIRSKGIESVRARVCNLSELSKDVNIDSMLNAIRTAYNALYGEVSDYVPTEKALNDVKKYYEKQISWEWKMGNTMPFDIELNERFSFGGVQMLFSLKEAVIEKVQVFSDAMDTELCLEISERLTGVRFKSSELYNALTASEKEPIKEIANYLLNENL